MQVQGLVFVDKGRVEVQAFRVDEEIPADHVLVRNRVSLISPGTELAFLMRQHIGFDVPSFTYAKYPWRPGYSAVGEVVKVGSAVTQFRPGDRVHNSGYHQAYMAIPADRCIKIPDSLSDERATFLQLVRIAMTAVRRAPIGLGENVVVIGMGLIGNLCAQLCQISGAATVAGVDLADQRLTRARECGIQQTWNTGDKPLSEHIGELSPTQADVVIEAVGSSATIDLALKSVAPGGRVVLLGSPRARMEVDPYFDIHRKAIHVIGAYGSGLSAERQLRDDHWMVSLLDTDRICVDPLLTGRMPFDQAAAGYKGLLERKDEHMGIILHYPTR